MTSPFIALQAAASGAEEIGQAAHPGVVRAARTLAQAAWRILARPLSRAHAGFCPTLCIVDFGAGATFLSLLQAWRTHTPQPGGWHVVAVLARPWSRDALRSILAQAAWGDPQDADDLLSQWPPLLPGQHRLAFAGGAVTLTLLFGEPRRVLDRARFAAHGFLGMNEEALGAFSRHAQPDAWWLYEQDGENQFQALRQVGFASRALTDDEPPAPLQLVRRRAGMGVRSGVATLTVASGRSALVIGAGIAGSSIASTLAQAGWQVQVAGASHTHGGHLAAALTPVISADDNIRARLTRAGALRARAHWAALGSDIVRRTGTLQLTRAGARAVDSQQLLDRLQFPPGWVRAVNAREASALAGLPLDRGGVFFADGWLVRPDRLIAHQLGTPGVTTVAGMVARIRMTGTRWEAINAQGATIARADQVIVAAAQASAQLLDDSGMLAGLPHLAAMHRLAGEVTYLPAAMLGETATGAPEGGPRCVLGGEGYILPGVARTVVVGSTYVHGASEARLSPQGQAVNLEKMRHLLGWEPGASDVREPLLPGWSGWRAVVAGRLPVIGRLPAHDSVWVACGYASRGLTWSALGADMIVGALRGEPDILERDLARAIAPR